MLSHHVLSHKLVELEMVGSDKDYKVLLLEFRRWPYVEQPIDLLRPRPKADV